MQDFLPLHSQPIPFPKQVDPHLLWLDQGLPSRELVGGKGASLSRLCSFGALVPPAFALTTHCYAAVANHLDLPRTANDVTDAQLPLIRERLMTASLPGPVRAEVEAGFQAFQEIARDGVALAVRSSAVAEDSAEFSFAGLHDTILDVRSLDGLEAAVKQCWASLWSERAVAYRRASGHRADDGTIAVVVQLLVRSDVSFVVFTADPVSERADTLVIAATWGLGEAVVSGLVVPDHIVVGADGELLEYSIGAKHLMVIPGNAQNAGTREVPVPRALQSAPVLTKAQINIIAAQARTLSAQLGYPADVEGGLAGDVIYLFQARPITTLRDTINRPPA